MRLLTPDRLRPRTRIANDFAVRPGAVWGWRSIPDPELVLVRDGRFRFEQEGAETIEAVGRQVLYIAPVVPHRLTHLDGEAPAIACWHGELADGTLASGDYRLHPAPATLSDLPEASPLPQLFGLLAATWAGYGPWREAQLAHLVAAIWIGLAGGWQAVEQRPCSHRTAAMVAWVRAHLDRRLTRREIAAAFGLTPEHVNACFRRELGMTPGACINRERVLAAHRLLVEEGISVAEAARRTGFCDAFHFSKVYRRWMCVPPSQAR